MNVIIVGIGLIGGSMARDLRCKYPEVSIYGMDASASHLEKLLGFNLLTALRAQKNFQRLILL